MKKIMFIIILIYSQSLAQDSLHLIFTFTGSLDKPIIAVGSLGDINYDGYDDFIIRKDSTKYCEIYFGGENIDLTHTFKLFDQPNTSSFSVLTNVGDLNGDGFNDYAQSCFHNNNGYQTGQVFIFYGSVKFDTIPDWSLQSNCVDGLLGVGNASGDVLAVGISSGDINGDQINDLLIDEPYNWCDGIGKAYLFFGGDTLYNKPDYTFNNKTYGFLNSRLTDINGDGYDDIMIDIPGGAASPPNVPATLALYYGGNSIDTISGFVFDSLPVESHIVPIGDFNGDGYDDFYITKENKLYFGSENFNADDTLKFKGDGKTNSFGNFVYSIDDINSDGFSDLLINDNNHLNSNGVMVGGVYIYLGGNQPDTTFDFFLEGETKWSGFGYGGSLGDINGDGYNEFYVFALNYPDVEKETGKIYVYSMKKFIVGVADKVNSIPRKYSLSQNYPNPFNPTTEIEYQIPKDGFVNITVYNTLGQEVAVLVNQIESNGKYSVQFNAANLPSGVYLINLKAKTKTVIVRRTIKALLIK